MPKLPKHPRKTSKTPFSLSTDTLLSNPSIVVAAGLLLFLAVFSIQAARGLTTDNQQVLGDSEENEEAKQAEEMAKEAEKQAEEVQKESAKQAEEQQKQQQEQQKEADKSGQTNTNPQTTSGSSNNLTKTKTEIISNTVKVKTESEGVKRETEIETADGQKIKTKTEDDGTTKIEVEDGTLKLKYRLENGQMVLKLENEAGEEVEVEEDDLEELENEVENEFEDDDLAIVPTTDNRLAVTQNQVAALTSFPLSVDLETNELVVTTPAGQRRVTVLPTQAVANLLATGIITRLETPADSSLLIQNGTPTGILELETLDDKMVYRVNGEKTYRIFGFIPFTAPVTAFVSTETGETVKKQQSLPAAVADLVSL